MSMRYDFLSYSANEGQIGRTPEGWLRDDPILSRVGVFSYRLPNGSTRKEFRPAEEVFSPVSMAGMKGIPVTNGHPALVTAATPAGIIGTVLSGGRQDGDNLRAELIIHDPKRMGTNREISLGYRVVLRGEAGTYRGERYDAVQTGIVYNHCAIVPKGRAGNSRLTLDGAGLIFNEDAAPRSAPSAEDFRKRMIKGHSFTARADAVPIRSAEDARRNMIKQTYRGY